MTDFADTTHTIEFVKEYLTAENAKILEVGCGTGRLALGLMSAGYRVTAIDVSPEKIETARRNGVRAEVADIAEFESAEKFDAVLFSRSLHHIQALETVLTKVKTLLDEKGRILVEDFALEQVDEKTADWFYELRDVLGALTGSPPSQEKDVMARWKSEHHHEKPLHSRADMLRAMERFFGNVHTSTAPYLYRYFVDNCESFPQGAQAVQSIFDWERKLIKKGAVQPIGLRMVAKKYFSYLK